MEIEFTASEIASIQNRPKRTVTRRAVREGWPYRNGKNRVKRFPLPDLPADVQTALVKAGKVPESESPNLAPEAALALVEFKAPSICSLAIDHPKKRAAWTDKTAVDRSVLDDPAVGRWVRILQEARDVPKGWKKRAWVEAVAIKHKTTFQTIYRKEKAYQQKGLAGLHHTKKTKGTPRAWTPEAIDWWVGLCLRREHRKIDRNVLYAILEEEAARRGWQIGGYRSALLWLENRVTPQLRAIQRGGIRALDNTLPPVLRDYSDLEPFEILVGDQHKWDFWVVDEETGIVFRPEGYYWQDLRTRLIYGGALDRKYDGYLIGLALRMGLRIFGPFGSIYTDNGKPELSRYVAGVLKDMRSLGLNAEPMVDAPVDVSGLCAEEINPLFMQAGSHRKAIVKNAKAKMIEGTFNVMEGIMRGMRIPGNVKDLGGDPNENDVDQEELQRLARQGKLLTFWEFARVLFQAMDHYNREKAHRGVLKEWAWRPKPREASPMDCLERCYHDGWRPVHLSEEAIDLVFLPRTKRIADRGRITFRGEQYEAGELMELPKSTRLEVRYDPLDPGWILAFRDGEFLCRCEPVEYSSMKDMTLAQRKIEEKRRRRKGFVLEYRSLTRAVPDVRRYSETPWIERAAAQVGRAQRKNEEKLLAEAEENRVRTPDELDREVAAAEARQDRPKPSRRRAPKRPSYFLDPLDRYKWAVQCELSGGALSEEDRAFCRDYEAAMTEGEREHWEIFREMEGCG